LSGRSLCDELITRPEESYRLCCVVVCDLETSRIGAPYIYDISSLRVNSYCFFMATIVTLTRLSIMFCTRPLLFVVELSLRDQTSEERNVRTAADF